MNSSKTLLATDPNINRHHAEIRFSHGVMSDELFSVQFKVILCALQVVNYAILVFSFSSTAVSFFVIFVSFLQ